MEVEGVDGQFNAHQHVLDWLEGEKEYAEGKWGLERTTEVLPDIQDWVMQYIKRAEVLGYDNELGRQALAKTLRTLQAFTEAVVVKYGPLPPPGVPSGTRPMQ